MTPSRHRATQRRAPLKSARERMDVIVAYREVGTFRGAAGMCGTTHNTVRRIVEGGGAGGGLPRRGERAHNYDMVRDVVARRVVSIKGRISAKRLLVEARAAGYGGSARNFRRLVAEVKAAWRASGSEPSGSIHIGMSSPQ